MAAKRTPERVSARRAKPAANPARARASRTKPAAKATKRTAGPAVTRAAPPPRAEEQVARIQRVIDVMVAAGAVEVELEEAGSKLRVRLQEPRVSPGAVSPPEAVAPSGASAGNPAPAASPLPAAGEEFKSPMVGTFYRSPSPDADSFVKAGDRVTEDSVLCIIEAMKVMNEIKAETAGEIVEILAQNGEPVDYGQPLFVIRR